MAVKPITFCDACDKPQPEVGPILPTFFTEEGRELCYGCASAELQKMFAVNGVPPPAAVINGISPKTTEFASRREELVEKNGGLPIYVAKPGIPVEPGQVVKYGNPLRECEIIEEIEGKPGEWFVKLVG